MPKEQSLQLRHRRPFDPHRQVAPVLRLVLFGACSFSTPLDPEPSPGVLLW
jgi:hypothetical protein